MKFLELSVTGVVWRFYLMMALILVVGFTGLWYLAILALPLFFSALMGIKFKAKAKVKAEAEENVRINVNRKDNRSKDAQVAGDLS